MNKITGRIIIHETQLPISSLLVHFYSVLETTLPDPLRDESQWDKLYAAGWKGLTSTRLGSVQTTADGRIDFEYDPTRIHPPTSAGSTSFWSSLLSTGSVPSSRSINLWFAVLGPEITGLRRLPQGLACWL